MVLFGCGCGLCVCDGVHSHGVVLGSQCPSALSCIYGKNEEISCTEDYVVICTNLHKFLGRVCKSRGHAVKAIRLRKLGIDAGAVLSMRPYRSCSTMTSTHSRVIHILVCFGSLN